MQILIPPKQFTEGMRARALEHELRTGIMLKKGLEEQREKQAAAQAHALRGHKTIPGLGKCIAVIPEWEYFRMNQKYGKETNTKEFLRYFQRKFPELSPNKL